MAATQVRILVALSNLFSARVASVCGFVVLALFVLVGCEPAGPSSEVDSGAKKVVTFDGGDVTEGEVTEGIERLYSGQAAASGQPAPEVEPGSPQFEAAKSQVVPQLVAFNLGKAYAEENGIEVTGEEIEAEVEQTKEQVGQQAQAAGQDLTPDEAFQEALSQFGYTEDDFREEVRTGLTLEKVREEAVGGEGPTEQEIEDFYEENKETRFTLPERRCIRHILFSPDEEETAQEVKQQLDDGEDFAELAQEYSQDPGSAEQGGDLGCNPEGGFVPEFDEAAFSAEEGEISDPVETEFGFHVLEVTDIQEEEEVPLEEAAPEIEDQLNQQRQATEFEAWIDSELESRNVTYLPGYDPNEQPQIPGLPPGAGAPPEGKAPEGEAPPEKAAPPEGESK
ncbi:MAG: Peptidyl-prolyl cis-trans isomerase PpiD [uncultured Rubrobacteraceae bacterium]|uniref:peptidylprolyl isomerase n=1 Tax=uncultured Rubrobacteraceae bacterium TaxID=349277 RepID=A0A6J4QSV6_9ACTN|nr:MAG: Peptidyl-prolyl cis-trans isomerase PpiD [uncultured Rubrobacteraceae bacterium]